MDRWQIYNSLKTGRMTLREVNELAKTDKEAEEGLVEYLEMINRPTGLKIDVRQFIK